MDEMNALERQLTGVVRGAMRPPRAVDAAAIVRSATAASPPSRWSVVTRLRGLASQPPTTGGFKMLSALKYVAAAIILALFGGVLLSGLLTTQQDEEIPPAVATESAAPTIGSPAPEITSEPLTPSGIEMLTPSTGDIRKLVADGAGTLWSVEGAGRLRRFDPDTETTTEWTLADDFAFGQAAAAWPASVTPAAGEGVWLAGGDAARLFDGDRFAQVIEAPEALKHVVEADDGSLWAATKSGVVLRWDGSSWEDVGPASAGECDWIYALEVDSAGRLWVGGKGHKACKLNKAAGEVLVLEESTWTRFDESDAPPLGSPPRSIIEASDGSIWVASGGGLARFDGTEWTVETPAGGHPYGSLAASPDGSVWTHSDNRTGRVWRWDSTGWTKLDGPEGLPDEHWSADLVTIGEQIYLGTPEGTYEWVGDGWEQAWEVAPAMGDYYGFYSRRMLATGDDELWVADAQGVSQFQGGAWTDESDWKSEIGFWPALALGPDGTVWVAGPDGVAHRDGQRWEFVDGRDARAIAVDEEGTVWAARVRRSGRCHVWSLREVDGAWVRDDTDGCPLQLPGPLSMAVDGDGTVWLGAWSAFTGGGLARFADGVWESIDAVAEAAITSSRVLGADPDGVVWSLLLTDDSPSKKAMSMVRLFGDEVEVVDHPDGLELRWGNAALAPDGTVWTMSQRGLVRFDSGTWQYLDEVNALPGMQIGAIDTDGSVYGIVGRDIVRVPTASD